MMWKTFERISSRQNRTVKALIALQNEREAKKEGRLLSEGLRQIETAALKLAPELLLFSDDVRGENCFDSMSRNGFHFPGAKSVLRLEPSLFDKIAQTEHSQGVLAVFSAPEITAPSAPFAKRSKVIVLEEIQDPGNLGTISRTAEALGFDAIVLLGAYVWPYNAKCLRASMGSAMFIPYYSLPDVDALIPFLGDNDLLTADLGGEDLAAFRPAQPALRGFALLLGNEARGVSEKAREKCDACVSIAMDGRVESLNIAAAAAILAWQLRELYRGETS